VKLDRGDSLQGRLGLALGHESSWLGDTGQINRAQVYGVANLYQEFLNGTSVDVSGTDFSRRNDRTWGGLGVGGSYSWNGGKYSVFAKAS
jgi:fibronectin-binding autotransporter adhesin